MTEVSIYHPLEGRMAEGHQLVGNFTHVTPSRRRACDPLGNNMCVCPPYVR